MAVTRVLAVCLGEVKVADVGIGRRGPQFPVWRQVIGLEVADLRRCGHAESGVAALAEEWGGKEAST